MGEELFYDDDFENKDERPQVGFYLNSQDEKEKLDQLAKSYGLGKSACLRMLILRDWRIQIGVKK